MRNDVPLAIDDAEIEPAKELRNPFEILLSKIILSLSLPIFLGLSFFAGAISASSIARGTSFLKDKLNQSIFSNSINVIDKPDLIKGMGSKCFDSEGVKTETLK